MTCWLDSQAALWWIYGESKQFKKFGQSRVEKIRKLVNKERFRYVPSELNPNNTGSGGAKLSETRGPMGHVLDAGITCLRQIKAHFQSRELSTNINKIFQH